MILRDIEVAVDVKIWEENSNNEMNDLLTGGLQNPCAYKGCPQLCVLNVTGEGIEANCLCAAGYKMDSSSNKCLGMCDFVIVKLYLYILITQCL